MKTPRSRRLETRPITVQDVRDFLARLPEYAKGEEAGKEPLRVHLQAMIDTELLLMEARSQGIEKSSSYLTRMIRIRKAKLVGEYERRTIEVTVADGEVEEYIDREGLARAVRLGEIVVADLETAEEAAEADRGRGELRGRREQAVDERRDRCPGRGHRPVRHQGRHHSRHRREVVRARGRLECRIRFESATDTSSSRSSMR